MKISFKNIKSFDKTTTFKLKKLNVIIGPNSSGKSTLNQAIKYFSNLGKHGNELVDGKSTNFSTIVSYGKYYDSFPKYLFKDIDGKRISVPSYLNLHDWISLNNPLIENIDENSFNHKNRTLEFNAQKGIKASVDMKIANIPRILEDQSFHIHDNEIKVKDFVNPNGEKIPYFSEDEVDFTQILSPKDALQNIEKYAEYYDGYKKLIDKSPVLVPKDLINDKILINDINNFSKSVYRLAVRPIKDKESNSTKDQYHRFDFFSPWTKNYYSSEGNKDKYVGKINTVYNDSMRGYMYSTNYKFLDGLTMYSSNNNEIKDNKKTVITFENKTAMHKVFYNTLLWISSHVFHTALTSIDNWVKKSDWSKQDKLLFDDSITSHLTYHIMLNPHERMFTSSNENNLISSKKTENSSDTLSTDRFFNRKGSKEFHFGNHFDLNTFTERFYPAHQVEAHEKQTGIFHDYNFKNGEHDIDLAVNNLGFHSFFFTQDYMSNNSNSILTNAYSPSYYKEMTRKAPHGNFFTSTKYQFNIEPTYAEAVISDDTEAIVEFLKEIGHFEKWSKAFKIQKAKGRKKYSFVSINPKSKLLKSKELTSLKKKYEKILKLNKNKKTLFSNGLILSIFSFTVKSAIDNLVKEGVIGNPEFINDNYRDNILKMSKKYRVSQKSIVKEMMILDQHFLTRIINWYQSLAYDLLMSDYLQLFSYDNHNKIALSFDNGINTFQNIKASLLDKNDIFKNGNIGEKNLINLFGSDFQSLIDSDFPFDEDFRKNRGLQRLQKFINTSLKKMNIDYTFKIYPIMSKKIGNDISSENTGLFKLKLKQKGKLIDLAESGSGDTALISILGQLYFSNEWWLYYDGGINVVNKKSHKSWSKTSSYSKMISIHEPENHLHPKIISKFAEFLFNYTLDSKKEKETEFFLNDTGFIIETHSEIFIRKFQSLTRVMKNKFSNLKDKSDEPLVNLFYISKNKNGSSSIKNLGLQSDGFLSKKIPPGFFDINTNLISDLWKPSKKDKL